MADFIAVIRRAVSGLSNNTPEMRAKVYDKARTAVRRQLESMNPRPPEDMLLRQLEKLEAAIAEVDAEYSEALPAMEEALLDQPPFEPAYVEEPAPQAPAESHDVAPVEPEMPPAAEPVRFDDGAAVEPVDTGHYQADEPETTVAPDEDVRPAQSFDEMEPTVGVADQEPPVESEVVETWAQEPVYPDVEPAREETGWPEAEPAPASQPWSDAPAWDEPSSWPRSPESAEPDATPEPEQAAAEAVEPQWHANEPQGADPGPDSDKDVAPVAGPHAIVHEDIDLLAHVHKAIEPKPAATPAGLDLLDWNPTQSSDKPVQPSDLKDDDFDSWFPKTEELPAGTIAGAVDEQIHQFELDTAMPSAAGKGGKGDNKAPPTSREIDDLMAATEAKAYRIETRKKRNYTPILLGLAGLIVVAGGGYAVWSNKDAMSEFVSGLVASAPDVPAEGEDQTTDMAEDETPPPETATPDQAPVTADGESSGRKFTQRLLADGTEIDEGDGTAGVGEGRSVAEQSVASDNAAPGEQPAGATTPQATTPAAGDASAPATTPPPAATASAGEKAIVYEERLGQATPTAIPGRVEWTVLREAGVDGKPDPSVQGKLVIPDSGLTALITFKRNADSSLPASHLVEIVFSVPANFEGGAVQDVQRVAMKRTEQDRGDPLVAVTAKITDDTFLIALNDFQDVVARNVDLMRTRGWIDIPVTYRNGRRALLTLDKGPSGNAAFESVIKEWAALGKPTGG